MAAIPYLEKLTVQSRFLYPISVDMTSPDDTATRLLQPRVTAQIAGQQVEVYNPFGDPGNSWMLYAALALGGAAVLGALLVR